MMVGHTVKTMYTLSNYTRIQLLGPVVSRRTELDYKVKASLLRLVPIVWVAVAQHRFA